MSRQIIPTKIYLEENYSYKKKGKKLVRGFEINMKLETNIRSLNVKTFEIFSDNKIYYFSKYKRKQIMH